MAAAKTITDLRVDITNRHIIRIALPLAASFLVPQINFITNNIFIGGLGEQQLAVAGITGVYYLIFAVVGLGLNHGLQALISRRAGEGRISEIGNLFNQAIIISILLSAIGIVVTYFVAPYVLQHALHNATNIALAQRFLFIRIWGLPCLYVYQMRNALLVGTNNSRYLIIGTLAETITNIVLDYGFIYGHFGLPQLGFNGAAYASIIAEFTGVVVIFNVMRWKGISSTLNLFSGFAYNKQTIKLILNQSSPIILQLVISIASWEFFYILIEHHGERPLAISNAMRNIFGLFGCINWAFAATTNAMVSNVIGQDLRSRVIILIKKIMLLSVSVSLVILVLFNIAPQYFLRIYGQGEDFIREALPVVRVVSLGLVMQSVALVWLYAVTGTGNSRWNLVVEIVTIVLYCLYVYFTLEFFKLPITIGWMSEWLYWICLFTPSFWFINSGRWKAKKI